ncbi:hypothetical protein CTA2_10408 [Colletotrichum tanaceti]|uniref:Uncharacterized protein n=1 Tax=Colletotrichum tanaceti TaxID=1306861 RepID=A0A4U6X6H6_9PEZI|nr:hypothetical protein CTA2_10408 [Colletotrichum tanaceti]TKW50613.1 hypothetical protein CTA1_6265 [Colletotrichum tanaceti]
MATLFVPYNPAMQLGSGFNSFTQQLCKNNAVVRDPTDEANADKTFNGQAQEVTYKTSAIDKVTDITSAMNISPAFAIKYDMLDARGNGDFIHTAKIKDSDVSFLISVRVVNEVVEDQSLNKFDSDYNPDDVRPEHIADAYGDSFISGFQEGGEFTAVISIKAKYRHKASNIKASAAIYFTTKCIMDADGELKVDDISILEENETTISVTWSGGSRELKRPEDGWTLETMRAAALKFPDLVARTPTRTKAILTRYSALQSFQPALVAGQSATTLIPSYDKAEVYSAMLQEAYIDFKIIAKEPPGPLVEDQGQPSDSDDDPSVVAVEQDSSRRATRAYEPSRAGLETARRDVRSILNHIVAEVDAIARKPELAADKTGPSPCYLSPSLFKELSPESRPAHDSAGGSFSDDVGAISRP